MGYRLFIVVLNSVLNVKVLVATLNKEKALVIDIRLQL